VITLWYISQHEMGWQMEASPRDLATSICIAYVVSFHIKGPLVNRSKRHVYDHPTHKKARDERVKANPAGAQYQVRHGNAVFCCEGANHTLTAREALIHKPRGIQPS
jgi:hypothetical protein